MKKLIFVASVVILACLFSLTACSGGGGASVSPTASVANPPTATNPVTPSAIVLPPAPNRSANNETLAGISTTGTGVRDDVYRYIFTTYDSAAKRTAAVQIAKSFRNIYLNPPETTDQALSLAKEIHQAMDCFRFHYKAGRMTIEEAFGIENKMEAMYADTRARMKAYSRYNYLLDGTGSALPDDVSGACDAGGGL